MPPSLLMPRLLKLLRDRPSLKVASMVLLSRVLGMARDMFYARLFGGGALFDAFATAYRIPNMLRDLLGEGALSSAVVSRLAQVEAREGRARVSEVARRLMAFFGLLLIAVLILGELAAPSFAMALGPGFRDAPGKMELTIFLARVMFPYLALVGISALTMGLLHHVRAFGWAASASSFFNLAVMAGTGGCFLLTRDPVFAVKGAAAAVLAGGVVQWLSLWPGLRGTGISLVPELRFSEPEIRKVLVMIAPSFLSVAAVQINVAVNHAFASYLAEGSVSHIYYAFRLMQLPVGIVGVAISTVLLTDLSRLHAQGDTGEFSRRMNKAIADVAFLFLPAVAGLGVLGRDVVALIYERGHFTATDTLGTSAALLGYLPGILAIGLNKNLLQGYYACGDTRYPMRVACFSIFVNALLNYTLAFKTSLGIFGLTAGTSVVLFLNTGQLWWGLRKRHALRALGRESRGRLWIFTGSAGIMAGVLAGLRTCWADTSVLLRTPVLVGVGMLVYFGLWALAREKPNP